MAKSIIVPVAWIGILIWAFVSTDGGGEMWNQKATLEGSAYSWAFLSSLTSVIGNYATLSVNQVSLTIPPVPLDTRRAIWILINCVSPTSHATPA